MGKMSRDMAPWFRALAVLLEVPGYTFSSSMVAHTVYSSRYGESYLIFWQTDIQPKHSDI